MYSMDTRTVTWLFRTPAREGFPRISPNGRWLAYQSDEAGQLDVYIATLPPLRTGGKSRMLAGRSRGGAPTGASCSSSGPRAISSL